MSSRDGCCEGKFEYTKDWQSWAQIFVDCRDRLASIGEEPPEEGELREDEEDPGAEEETRDVEGEEVTKTIRDWLKEDMQEAQDECKRITAEYFNLWENLIAVELLPMWRQCVRQECHTSPHILQNGVRKEGKRGQTLPSHWFCRRAWLLKLTGPMAAENNNFYILTQVIKNPNIPCADHVDRMIEIDDITPHLPCLKDEEGMPAELPRADVCMPAVTMCMTILNSLPAGLQQAYHALKGANHCPTNVQDLKKDLTLIETQANQLAQATKFVNQASKKQQAQTSNTSGAGQMTSEKQRIPKKNRSKTGENPKGKANQKLCNKCVQWAPHIKNTHNTRDCYRWNNDGTPMSKKQKGTAPKDSNAIVKEVKAKENRMVERLDKIDQKQEKFQKEIMRMINKSAKKRKHHRRSNVSTSSSSDSD